jgi:diguanylate cyclase (GGDEF)-like protein
MGYTIRPMIGYFILGLTLNLRKEKKLFHYLAIPLAINALCSFSGFFCDWCYSFSSTNVWSAGTIFPYFSYFFISLYLVLIVVDVIFNSNRRSGFFILITVLGVLIIVLGMLFENLYGIFGVSRNSIIISVIFFYVFYQNREYFRDKDAIQYLARHDGLTGIYNRYAFDVFSEELKSSKKPMGFLILDIDNFKKINDNYGHVVGDVILKKVALLLEKTFEQYKVIRLGGDEFVVLLENQTIDCANDIISTIGYINKELVSGDIAKMPTVSVSAGLSFSEAGFDDNLYENADSALYDRKNTTRRGCTLYNPN